MKPILFNTVMTKAVRDDKKTATRRILKTKEYIPDNAEFGCTAHTPERHISCRGTFIDEIGNKRYGESFIKLPYCKGDILYVRETWFYEGHMHDLTAGEPDLPSGKYSFRYVYKADSPDYPVDVGVGADGWRPSIHMPKEAARIFLRVTDIWVERLQDIGGYGVLAEGIDNGKSNPTMDVRWENMQRMAYSEVWNSTIKKSDLNKYGWDANPWVTVTEFEKISKEEALCLTKQS